MAIDAAVLVGAALVALASAVAVVKLRDLVYASSSLAVLGVSTAVLAALLGYPVVAAFLVIVYVGAAVMFIIITVSMLGGGGRESRDEWRGLIAGSAIAAAAAAAFFLTGLPSEFSKPSASLEDIASVLLGPMLPAVIVMIAGLAVTVVEAISVARRGGG